ncbi:hypothetical protein ACI2K4_22435 [Micromonospora sp. NPDC050397]|uniref:hypothetical protein n=1 Tax=Micromonospora sp. NPDC050397 TaxID=3364279 RepID=UPI00384A5514
MMIRMPQLQRVGEPVTAPISAQAQSLLTAHLQRVDQLWTRMDIVVLNHPAETSEVLNDRKDPLRAYAHDLAMLATRTALDHLRAWQTLFTSGEIPVYAHFSLLRSAHESALFAYWLSEPGLDRDERRRRGIAGQVADLDERRKIEEAIGRTEATPGKLAAKRLEDLMDKATELGLTTKNKNGKTILAPGTPSVVELFDRYEAAPPEVKASYLYRLYSGYTHGKQWALMQGAQPQTPFDSSGRTLAVATSSEDVAAHATRRVVDAVERAIVNQEELRR